jgi:hypothetical protein
VLPVHPIKEDNRNLGLLIPAKESISSHDPTPSMNLWSPPPGWTADSKELNFDYYWGDPDGDGQMMARQLTSPQPVMRSTWDSGELLYMI